MLEGHMRRHVISLLLILTLLNTAGCSSRNIKEQDGPKAKPVKAVEIKEEKAPEVLEYFGTISSGEIKKMSFKFSGKIASIPVEKGDAIKKGSVLAKLDTKDLEYSIKAAKAQMNALESQIAAAESAYNYANDNFKKAEKLLKENAISQSSYDEAKLNLEVRQSDLNTVREQKNQSSADYQQKMSMLADAVMISGISGYVVDIQYHAGEMVSAGYPVVIIRNEAQIANAGLSQKDVVKVRPGMKVEMDVDGIKASGAVSNISDVPDSQTRTYNTEISIDESNFPLGATVHIKIITGEVQGIWIPISSVLSGEKDYVFIAEKDHAIKKEVAIKNINGGKVLVEGLESGQQLIVEGSKRLKHMDLISLQQGSR